MGLRLVTVTITTATRLLSDLKQTRSSIHWGNRAPKFGLGRQPCPQKWNDDLELF